jgi:lactoylglutathione lyase
LTNTWLALHTPEPPTDDKPDVHLAPPDDLSRVSAFMEIRVANIHQKYQEWAAKGAQFLTEPKDRGGEIRCFMRDPDGHLIELGEATGVLAELTE